MRKSMKVLMHMMAVALTMATARNHIALAESRNLRTVRVAGKPEPSDGVTSTILYDTCSLDIELESCMVIVDQLGGFMEVTKQNCSEFSFHGLDLESCKDTPHSVRFHYGGGGCGDQQHTPGDENILDFNCKDSAFRAVEVKGLFSYILVTNPQNENVFFEGWVAIGAEFGFGSPDDGPLVNGFKIQIFRSNEVQDPNNLLQEVVYLDPLCSSHLELSSRLGAMRIVSYHNERQGKVAMFASFGFSVELTFSISVNSGDDRKLSMSALHAASSFAGLLDLTDDVRGSIIEEDRPAIFTLDPLSTTGGKHSLIVTAKAERDGSTIECTETELFAFDVDIDINGGLSNLLT